MKTKSPFDAVVFSGGGSRCFWQVGFWEIAAPELGISPRVVAGSSAGSAMACLIFSGKAQRGIDYFKKITAVNESNFYPKNIFSKKPVFPHYNMYRDTLLHSLDGDGFNTLKSGPDVRALVTRPPRYLGPQSGTVVGLLAYALEKHTVNPVHQKFAYRLGFRGEVGSVRECSSAEQVADMVLQSSCTPPMVPIQLRGRGPVLDGGLIDNVPVSAIGPDAGKTLLLLTRLYPQSHFPQDENRVYVQPSQKVPIGKWDYTSPDLVDRTVDHGRRDGEAFVREWKGRL